MGLAVLVGYLYPVSEGLFGPIERLLDQAPNIWVVLWPSRVLT